MADKLFIVCPFSFMETFLRNKYGDDIFFLTYAAAVIQGHHQEFKTKLKHFIFREKIKTIYVVNDSSCRFLNSIIRRDKLFGLPSERIIEELYMEHYFSDFKDQDLLSQQQRLAELNVSRQLTEIMNLSFFGKSITEFSIETKGLVTSKEKQSLKEIRSEHKSVS